MRILIILSLISIVLLGSCINNNESIRGTKLYIVGDAQSVDAEIYIDGQKVGIMEKHVYSGPRSTEEEIEKQHKMQQQLGIKPTNPLKTGDIFAVGVDIRIKSGEKKPEYGIYRDIKVPSGKHEILFISKKGKRLKKELKMNGENYISVDFKKMIIQGE